MLQRNIIILLISSFLFACSAKKENAIKVPDDIVPIDTMAAIMADIHLAEAEAAVYPYNDTAGTVNLPAYYRFVFNKHKIDTAVFGKNFRYYESHPEIMNEVYTKVLENLSKQQADFKNND